MRRRHALGIAAIWLVGCGARSELGTDAGEGGSLSAPRCDEGARCDDGDACTVDDACRSGSCQGEPMVCPDVATTCLSPTTRGSATGECVAGECAYSAREEDCAMGCFDGACSVLSAGAQQTCAARGGDDLGCAGRNDAGQLGNTNLFDSSTRLPTLPPLRAVAGAGGLVHMCALDREGVAWCWGGNLDDQLGLGPSAGALATAPSKVVGVAGAVALSLGRGHSCVLDTEGSISCWGANDSGQLGDGTTFARNQAVVATLPDAVAVAAGGSFTCAIATSGVAWCWGSGGHGQLGDGQLATSSVPVAVVGLQSAVRSIAAGATHACAVTEEGDVWCWGDNQRGQIGDGTHETRAVPVPVALDGPVRSLALGSHHSCAVLEDGRVFCWGDNGFGQLGLGSAAAELTLPTDAAAIAEPVFGVVANAFFTCAAGDDLWCWGQNAYGQFGDGTALDAFLPVAVGWSSP